MFTNKIKFIIFSLLVFIMISCKNKPSEFYYYDFYAEYAIYTIESKEYGTAILTLKYKESSYSVIVSETNLINFGTFSVNGDTLKIKPQLTARKDSEGKLCCSPIEFHSDDFCITYLIDKNVINMVYPTDSISNTARNLSDNYPKRMYLTVPLNKSIRKSENNNGQM